MAFPEAAAQAKRSEIPLPAAVRTVGGPTFASAAFDMIGGERKFAAVATRVRYPPITKHAFIGQRVAVYCAC